MVVWLSGWTIGVVALVSSAIKAWRQPAGVGAYAAALFLTFFATPFVLGELFGIGAFVWMTGAGFALVVAALIATNIAFFQWLKAPTADGRKVLDRIAGLRLYLGVAERDELARQTAPPMTADEFQKFLPYALALGVEKTWADRFAAAVGPAAAAAAIPAGPPPITNRSVSTVRDSRSSQLVRSPSRCAAESRRNTSRVGCRAKRGRRNLRS